jgi:hypothetical protein
MTDHDELGDAAGWRCWLCAEPVPQQAKANDPNQAVADQVRPAGKGEKGRGEVRLAHKRCNDLRKGRPPQIPWPDRFPVVDAPELLQSLTRLDKRPGKGGEIVATFPDEPSAEAGLAWVLPLAEALFPGQWDGELSPLAAMTAVRLTRLR